MSVLRFDRDELRPIVEHAARSQKFRRAYSFEGAPDPFPCLLLVHDEGIYLMSGGDPGLDHPESTDEKRRYLVAYAKGCSPERDADYYEESRHLVGGDDFVEALPLEWFTRAFDETKWQQFCLRITEQEIRLFGRGAAHVA